MATETKNEASNKPVFVKRAHGVKVSVFANRANSAEGNHVFFKTTVQKIYRDGETWKTTSSLGRDDLPIATLLLQQAFGFILEAEAEKVEA